MTLLFLDHDCAARAPLAEAIARKLARWDHDVWAAGWEPSFVRREVRDVLSEDGYRDEGLIARALPAVPLDEVDIVVCFVADVGRLRVRAGVRRIDWRIPDPSSAPPEERLEAYRAARDEIARRTRELLRSLEVPAP
jgi:protein-tyrosine-phosphatase